jgi:hypothetical protein
MAKKAANQRAEKIKVRNQRAFKSGTALAVYKTIKKLHKK